MNAMIARTAPARARFATMSQQGRGPAITAAPASAPAEGSTPVLSDADRIAALETRVASLEDQVSRIETPQQSPASEPPAGQTAAPAASRIDVNAIYSRANAHAESNRPGARGYRR